VKARATGAVLLGCNDVVVAENQTGVVQPPPQRRNARGPEATIVGVGYERHGLSGVFFTLTIWSC
jgi:hypothetical protein